MSVIVDTPVWSEFFRRREANGVIKSALSLLIENGEALLIGPVRQELLSGVRDHRQFEKLATTLRAFPNVMIRTDDYEIAATYFTTCRVQGIQGSNTDFLICALSYRLQAPIFTLDRDFLMYSERLSIRLFDY